MNRLSRVNDSAAVLAQKDPSQEGSYLERGEHYCCLADGNWRWVSAKESERRLADVRLPLSSWSVRCSELASIADRG